MHKNNKSKINLLIDRTHKVKKKNANNRKKINASKMEHLDNERRKPAIKNIHMKGREIIKLVVESAKAKLSRDKEAGADGIVIEVLATFYSGVNQSERHRTISIKKADNEIY